MILPVGHSPPWSETAEGIDVLGSASFLLSRQPEATDHGTLWPTF